jgi:hypothetical protein
MSGVGVAMD